MLKEWLAIQIGFTVSFLMDDLQAVSDHPVTYHKKQIWVTVLFVNDWFINHLTKQSMPGYKNVIEYLLSCAQSDFPINCHQK